MAQAGPIVAAVLSNLPGEGGASSKIDVEKETHVDKKNSGRNEKNKAITHHYKITKTSTVEVDDSMQEKDQDEAEQINETANRQRRSRFCGCFGFLKK